MFAIYQILFVSSIIFQIAESVYPLNWTCSAPISQGGRGTCSPDFCRAYSSAPTCVFSAANGGQNATAEGESKQTILSSSFLVSFTISEFALQSLD
jgi:hypothetical protein